MRFLNIIQLRKISKLTMKLYASLQMIQVGFKRKLRVMQRFYETKKKKGGPQKFQIEYHLKRGKGTTFLKIRIYPKYMQYRGKKTKECFTSCPIPPLRCQAHLPLIRFCKKKSLCTCTTSYFLSFLICISF